MLLNNQGRKKSQIVFSTKLVTVGYYGVLACIILFLISEYLL